MKKKLLILVTLMVCTSLSSCMFNSSDTDLEKNNDISIRVNKDDSQLLNRSEDIADLVVELYGVDDSTAIIFNEDVYIGLVLAFDKEFTEEIREILVYQIKEKDEKIENIYISHNAKVFKQINDLVFNLLQGKSYDSQVKDINKIAEKIKKER